MRYAAAFVYIILYRKFIRHQHMAQQVDSIVFVHNAILGKIAGLPGGTLLQQHLPQQVNGIVLIGNAVVVYIPPGSPG